MSTIKDPFVYALVRVNIETFQDIPAELEKFGYRNIKSIVPTISLLQKSYRGTNTYQVIPLLFNYGFLKLRRSLLFNRDFVNSLPKNIPSIYSWVKSLEDLHPKKIKKRIDEADIFDDFSQVATVSRSEVKRFMTLSKNNQIYSADDITSLEIGSLITLHGYPYEGIPATVLEVNTSTTTVKVQICHDIVTLTIDLDFAHIFYTPYKDMDPDKLLANTCLEYFENTKTEEIDEDSIEY